MGLLQADNQNERKSIVHSVQRTKYRHQLTSKCYYKQVSNPLTRRRQQNELSQRRRFYGRRFIYAAAVDTSAVKSATEPL